MMTIYYTSTPNSNACKGISSLLRNEAHFQSYSFFKLTNKSNDLNSIKFIRKNKHFGRNQSSSRKSSSTASLTPCLSAQVLIDNGEKNTWIEQSKSNSKSNLKSNPNPTSHVSIYDTTLRDGSQMVGISLSVNDKLKIAKLLIKLGVEYIEGGWPGSNPKDAEFFSRWGELKHFRTESQSQSQNENTNEYEYENGNENKTKLAAFGSTRYKNSTCESDANVQALLKSNADVITLVAKFWDAQVEKVLETSHDENISMISDTVAYFKERDKEVMVDAEHFFDGFFSNREFALKCVHVAAESGADVIVLCDTNGGSMPWQIEEGVNAVKEVLQNYPHVRIGIHTHNDCELAVANSIVAVRSGASVVQGCMNGYGERTGNANLISILAALQLKVGLHCVPSASICHLTDIASEIAELAGQKLNPSQPFVGSSAFAHKGGIHVAAIRKMPESYNHIDPTVVGNSMRSVVSELSGRGNILEKAERSGLILDRDIAGSVLARIKQMENQGFAFENAEASVDMLIVRRGKEYKQQFQVIEFSVISSNRGQETSVRESEHDNSALHWLEGGVSSNQAIVKLRVDGVDQLSAAEGNGPVDALSIALKSSLLKHYPQLEGVQLSDYRVRLLEPSEERCGTMSTTRVTIDFKDSSGQAWTTVGAHTSIVEASFRALVDGLEFGIVNCSEDGCNINRRN